MTPLEMIAGCIAGSLVTILALLTPAIADRIRHGKQPKDKS